MTFTFLFLNMLVECDGIYWHSTDEAKRNDEFKNRLAKDRGYSIVRLSEKFINERIEEFREFLNDRMDNYKRDNI